MADDLLSPSPSGRPGLDVLRAVSRSFYLSIRLLPPALREPVGLAYLLARATDTIADTGSLPAADRLARLTLLADAIAGSTPARAALPALAQSFAPLQADRGEQRLILALPQCLAWLDTVGEADRADIREVLRLITRGQSLDVERFGAGTGVRALASAAELEEYTYLVAGCVGEFWTSVCARHLPGFACETPATMREWGRAYGMGLQLVNILRDTGEDLAAGRCYLPADELAAAGVSPADALAHPANLHAVRARWLARAEGFLADGVRYARAVESRRIRAATVLPALIGAR
ncbi:MAG: squalene/phytoene synthase family protein, partial [Burkholderiaceae bacterium]